VVVPEGGGTARRFACPYHAWTYDDHGALVGLPKRDDFGEIDERGSGLTPLAVAERSGLVFVSLDPDAALAIDPFLSGYGEMLDHLGLDTCHLVGRQSIPGPNWKIAYDGYLDFYHLPILHRNTFGSGLPNDAFYDAWGPHQRVSMPSPALLELERKPEDEWDPAQLIGGVWTIFPHVSIADFDAGGKLYLVSQLFPGATAAESVTVQSFLSTTPPEPARQPAIDAIMALLRRVVEEEDYATGLRIQRAMAAKAKEHVLFGRNEGGGQRFHDWVDALLATDDADLAQRFVDGIDG